MLLYSCLERHLGNGTGHRTVTMVAPLLLTSGPVRYEAGLPVGVEVFVVVYVLATPKVTPDLWQCILDDNFIVLPHWDTRPLVPMTCYPTRSQYPDTGPTSLNYPNNVKHQARKQQVSILKSSIWFNQGSNLQDPNSNLLGSESPISQNGRRTLYSFGHPVWFFWSPWYQLHLYTWRQCDRSCN